MHDRTTAGNPVRLDPEETDKLLHRFNVPRVPQRVVYSPEPDDAVRAAEEFGYPVVLKAFTPTLVHKSDIGGVRMFLHDDHQVSRAAIAIQERVPDLTGYLLQSQAPGGHEVMIECSRRAGFGPVIQIGLGGGWTELVGDVSVRIAPLDHQIAREMIDELRGAPLLYGQHGARAANIDALIEMLVNLSRLVVETPQVVQLDINPAIAGAYEVTAVDTRVFWDDSQSDGEETVAARETGSVDAVQRMLSPGSVAVIGDMQDEAAPGRRLVEALRAHGFAGDLYPVDSRATEVLGLRSYPMLSMLPAVPDLACIVDSPEMVAATIRACGEIGIPSAIVYSHVTEKQTGELREAARATGIRICGPDTAGVLSQAGKLHAGLDPVPHVGEVSSAGVAFLTQSGALGSWLLGQHLEAGAGPSCWIDSGREIDLTLSDYLRHLADDPDTRVIAVVLDTLHAPGAFIQAAETARASGKAVLVFRPAQSLEDRPRAGEDRAFNAALRRAGAARVPDLQTLADAALALAWQPAPDDTGVGVISMSDGAARIIAGESQRLALTVPALARDTIRRIRESETPLNGVANPMPVGLELARDPAALTEIAGAILDDPRIESLVLALSPAIGFPAQRAATGIARAARSAGKPVLVCLPGPETTVSPIRAAFHTAHVPVFSTPERVVRTLRVLTDISNSHHEPR